MELDAQLIGFFTAVAIGWILGFIFDFYRVTRGIFHPKPFMTMLMDGVYWLVALAVAFLCLLFSNWAQMRFYIFIGIIGGWIVYYKLVSTMIVLFMLRCMRCLLAVGAWLKKGLFVWLIHPLGYCFGIFLYPFYYCRGGMRNLRQDLKKRSILRKKPPKKEEFDDKS